MMLKELPFLELSLYIGSVKGYKGVSFTESNLQRVIGNFQTSWKNINEWTVALRITKTSFICGDYQEGGWEIAAINYPRFPKTEEELTSFMTQLQEFLMLEFDQNRISLIIRGGNNPRVILSERENAETNHK